MHRSMAILIVLFAAALPAPVAQGAAETFQTDPWQYVPVQDGGRYKPLDTLARETLPGIVDGTSFAEPETGRMLGPTALYLALLLQREDWGPPADPHVSGGLNEVAAYFASHEPDKWDKALLLPVDRAEFRKALGMPDDQRRISPWELSKVEIRDPEDYEKTLFVNWVQRIHPDEKGKFTKLEKAAQELGGRLMAYHTLRTGREMRLIPMRGAGQGQQWFSAADLARWTFSDRMDPTGKLQEAQEHFRNAKAAYIADSPKAFNEASAALLAILQEEGPKLMENPDDYPSREIIGLEITSNRWRLFHYAWILTLIASVALVLSCMNERWKGLYITGVVILAVSLVVIVVGLGIRWVLKESPPVTNLYESVVFTALGTVAFGLVFGLWSGRRGIFAPACVMTTLILVLADLFPSVLDPTLRPLPPVLRSNTWLAIHVMTIMLGYAALAKALAIGNVTLGFYLVGSQQHDAIKAQSRFTYESLKAGVLLLLIGTFLGAGWADYSWGRFWGWDKKEVWALITLLGYLAILHARYTNWLGNRGMTAWSVSCFSLVLVTWYLINFLKGGLHNYGLSGGEAPYYVVGAIVLQLLFVAAAVIASYIRQPVDEEGRSDHRRSARP
ncbi:MAG: cytochrome c biogenesis protein CcsA [Candidatus Nealsonbacteria bacterium]|nr:cytochrome c biogenesis protein CcsA [Candidatus Nealsonbacteria bacterium]